MSASGRKSNDDLLAAELAAGKTVKDAAAAVGLSDRTVYRRLADLEFKIKIHDLRRGMIDAAAGRLASNMAKAADVLQALLTDPDPNIRHKAAVKMIELGGKTVDLAEIEDRLKDLDARLDEYESRQKRR